MLIKSNRLRLGNAVGRRMRWLACVWFSGVVTASMATAQVGTSTNRAEAGGFELAREVVDWFAEGGKDEPAAMPTGVSSARVEVRFEGLLVGEGQATGEHGLAEAMHAAMSGLRAHTRGTVEGLGSSLAVSVEFGGDWIPLTQAQLESPDLMLARGIDSLGVRHKDKHEATFASAFHSQSPASRPTHQEMSTLAARVLGNSLAAAEPATRLSAERGVRFYRFESEQWAQAGSGGALVRLHRGADLIPEREAWRPGFAADLSELLVGHLAARASGPEQHRWAPVDLLTCEPVGRESKASSRALAVLALERAAASERLGERARRLARDAADAVWAELEADEGECSPQVAGLLWMAGRSGVMPASVRTRVDTSLDATLAELESIPWSGSPSEAIGLWALADRSVGDSLAEGRVAEALGQVIAARGVEGMVSLQPWAAWADAALHDADEALRTGAAMRQMRDVMWEHQFGPLDAGYGSEDFLGGLVFSSGGLVSSATIRPMVFAAWALGEPRLTSDDEVMGGPDRRGELLRVLAGMRFVRQLTVDEVSAYRSVLPAKVVGGVRRTLWDSAVYADETALALLASLETLESLQARVSDGD